MALPTVCVGEGYTWRYLKPEHVGVPYSPEGFMSREHFEVGSTQPSSQAAHSQAKLPSTRISTLPLTRLTHALLACWRAGRVSGRAAGDERKALPRAQVVSV